jgi:hypothetical protein
MVQAVVAMQGVVVLAYASTAEAIKLQGVWWRSNMRARQAAVTM